MLFQTHMFNSIQVYLYNVFHYTNCCKAALQKICNEMNGALNGDLASQALNWRKDKQINKIKLKTT